MKTIQTFFDYLRIEALKLFRFLPFYGGILLMVGIGIANFWNFDAQVDEHYQRILGTDPTLNFEYFYLSKIGQKLHFLAYFATLILVLLSMEIEQRAKFFTFRLPILLLKTQHYLFAKWFIINLFVLVLIMGLHSVLFEFITNRFPYGVFYLKNTTILEVLFVHFGQMLVVWGAMTWVMFAFLLYFRLNWIFAFLLLSLCYGLSMFLPAFYPFSALHQINFYEKKSFFTPDVALACIAGGLAYFFSYQKIRKS